MSVLKNVAVFLLCAGGLVALLSVVLPDGWEVSRDIEILTHPEDVEAQMRDLETWRDWSPWGLYEDAGVTMTVSSTVHGTDDVLTWSGKGVGKGTLTLAPEGRDNRLTFTLLLRGKSEVVNGTFQYTGRRRGATVVAWTLQHEAGPNPFDRCVALYRRYTIGPTMADALARLKRKIERGS